MIDPVFIQPIEEAIDGWRRRDQLPETLEVSRGTIWLFNTRPGSKNWDGTNFNGVRVVENNDLQLGNYRMNWKETA